MGAEPVFPFGIKVVRRRTPKEAIAASGVSAAVVLFIVEEKWEFAEFPVGVAVFHPNNLVERRGENLSASAKIHVLGFTSRPECKTSA